MPRRRSILAVLFAPLLFTLVFCGGATDRTNLGADASTDGTPDSRSLSPPDARTQKDAERDVEADVNMDVPDGSFRCGTGACKLGRELCLAITECAENDAGNGVSSSDGGVSCIGASDACAGCDCLWPNAAAGARCAGGGPGGGEDESVISCEGDAASGVTLGCEPGCGA